MAATMATLTSKYQITIPKELREDMKVKAGDKLVFIKKGDEWRLISTSGKASDILAYLGRGLKGDIQALHKEFEEAWDDPERP